MPKSAFAPNPTQLNRALFRPLLPLLCSSLLAAAPPPTAGDPATPPTAGDPATPPATGDPAPIPLIPPIAPPVPPPTKPGQQPPPGQITQISETRYRLGKIEFEQVTRTITFGATLNMNKGMLEYALVTQTGKVHEALLATDISPFNLNLALIVLKYKPAENFFPTVLESPDKQPSPEAKASPIDQSNRFDISVTWKGQDGIKKTARIEDWVDNRATKKKAESSPFIYTGSQVGNDGIYAAQATGSIVALYNDPLAIFNNSRKGSDSDEIWYVGSEVPPLQTKVQVTFYPHPPPLRSLQRRPQALNPKRKFLATSNRSTRNRLAMLTVANSPNPGEMRSGSATFPSEIPTATTPNQRYRVFALSGILALMAALSARAGTFYDGPVTINASGSLSAEGSWSGDRAGVNFNAAALQPGVPYVASGLDESTREAGMSNATYLLQRYSYCGKKDESA